MGLPMINPWTLCVSLLFVVSLMDVIWFHRCSGVSVKKTKPDRTVDFKMSINMPAEQPPADEAYVCTSLKIPRAGYAIGFRPTASADRVHHMLLFGCKSPGREEGTWSCVGGTCREGQSILYAWARNAPALTLPDDVGAPIGFDNVQYLVLQVHYAKKFDGNVWDNTGVTLDMVTQEPPYISAIFLFATGGPAVPPDTPTHFMNMSCSYHGGTDLYPFAFRTHTHGFGRVVSAGIYRDNKWIIIGKRNPQWPQIFQKIEGPLPVIHSGDTLAGQCRYNSTGHMGHVHVGAHGDNEMCNFYMMFYWDSKVEDPFKDGYSGCGGSRNRALFSTYPEKAYGLLPKKPELEMHAHQSSLRFGNHHHGSLPRWKRGRRVGNDWTDMDEALPRRRGGPGLDSPIQDYSGYPEDWNSRWNQGREEGRSGYYGRPDMVRTGSRKKPGPGFQTPGSKTWGGEERKSGPVPVKPVSMFRGSVIEKEKWSSAGNVKFGQISGLSFDPKGNLVVFHRGEKVWGASTFGYGNTLVEKAAIKVDTVVTMNPSTGSLLSSWGANSFFVPHGITVDRKGNVWLTDVGLHQVLKYVPDGQHMKLARSWGERFVPGTDKEHFCKPAAVALLKDGSFFVADGYCNNRIVRFAPDGSFVTSFGSRTEDSSAPLGTFLLPHDIGIHEEMNHLHVADRQNGRLQCLFLNGTPAYDIRLPEDFLTLYSLDYSIQTKEFFLLPGEKPRNNPGGIKAFAASPDTHLTTYSWAPKETSFVQPHVIRVSPDGSFVYIGEIGGQGGLLWKFEIQREKVGAPKHLPETHAGSSDSGSSNKPGESTDQMKLQAGKGSSVLLILAVVVVVPALLIALLCVCLRFRKQGGFRAANILSQSGFRDGKNGLNGAFRSHKGFQPLRTEDIDAVDDLTEESDNEDTLYAAPPRRGPLAT